MRERLADALAVLIQRIPASELEQRLRLSRGYLGRCLAGQKEPGPILVLLLEVLARHPRELDRLA